MLDKHRRPISLLGVCTNQHKEVEGLRSAFLCISKALLLFSFHSENGHVQLDGDADRSCVTPARLDVSAGNAGRGCLKNRGALRSLIALQTTHRRGL